MRIRNWESLVNHGNTKGRELVCTILEAGLEAADPYYNTLRLIRINNGKLYVGDADFEPIDSPRSGVDVYDLSEIDRIFVFGAGKGIQGVARALEEKLGDRLTGGHIIVKYGDTATCRRLEVSHGGHPIPDENCVSACKKMLDTIQQLRLTPRDIVFTIVGNGVSSLLTLPIEGVSLGAVKKMVHLLQIEKGVGTGELSFVRNQIDKLKGGRITRMLHPAKMVHIVTVDCNYGNTGRVGYDGLVNANIWLHTLPDMSSPAGAKMVLRKWDAWDAVDESIRNYLNSVIVEQDVLKADEFEQMNCRIFGVMPDKLGFVPAAMKKADELGYPAHLINKGHFMEASVVGRFFGNMAKLAEREGTPFPAPCALFFTGETLVTVGNNNGVGGRNQECALTAATVIEGSSGIVVGAVDTDGTDGPGGFFDETAQRNGVLALSGGVVDGSTMAEAVMKNVDIAEALKTHATSKALWKLDCGVWATQNISLQDLVVALVMPKED